VPEYIRGHPPRGLFLAHSTEGGHQGRNLIHRSAWKGNSQKFANKSLAIHQRLLDINLYRASADIPRGKGARGMHVLKIEYPVADYDSLDTQLVVG
jgi:hypothetical protein